MSRSSAVLLLLAVLLIAASIVASATGALGGVVVCGADRTPGCITWPMPVSEVLWTAFVLGVAALLLWQLRT
jgi:hypothetical protein